MNLASSHEEWRRSRSSWIFRFGTGAGRRMPGPACRMPDFRRRSGCIPAESYPPLKQPKKNIADRSAVKRLSGLFSF
jgi:hypothetical protein